MSAEDEAARRGARVLVTGANGFIGAALVQILRLNFDVRRAVRVAETPADIAVGELGERPDWSRALEGCSAVVHLAGPAHGRFSAGVLERCIVKATADLAASAAQAGVERFVYLSSIHAAAREAEHPLNEAALPAPHGAYGRAKLAAERAVLRFGGLRPVVLRPPLVHAPKAKANWAALLRLADSPLPLPFEGISNRRHLLALSSLCGAIQTVLQQCGESGVFHLADQPALSTPELVTLLRRELGRPPNLFRLPGVEAIAPRPLVQSLQIDASRFANAFGFKGCDTRAAVEADARLWKRAR